MFSLFSIRCCSMWTTNNLLIMFIESKNNACDLRHNSNNSDWMRFDVITFYYSLTSIQFSHDGKLFAYRKYDEVVQIYYNPPAKYCMLMLTGRSIQFENWWIYFESGNMTIEFSLIFCLFPDFWRIFILSTIIQPITYKVKNNVLCIIITYWCFVLTVYIF